MLTKEEVQKIDRTVARSKTIKDLAFKRDDGVNKPFVQTLWNHPGNDVAGVLARINRVAGTMEQVRKMNGERKEGEVSVRAS